MFESADANSFGMVVRGSFESTVVSGYYGRGPADAFFRKYFGKGVQDVLNLYENYVTSMEKGKLSRSIVTALLNIFDF